jgi:hypothetical protein
MPNWCNNVLIFKHKDPAMLDRAVQAFNRDSLLQEFIPCPQELLDTVSGFMGQGTPEQAALEAQQAANVKKYGYASWFEFCNNEWGTKWDISDGDIQVDDLEITMSFDTAWSPPLEAYSKLLDLDFEVKAYYFEPGCGFAGIWDNGDDDYYSDWFGSKGAQEMLPEELDEAFYIVENLEMWEEDSEQWT